MGFFDDDDIEPKIDQLVENDAKMADRQRETEMLSEARKYVVEGNDLIPFKEKVKNIENNSRKKWLDVLYNNRGLICDFYDSQAAEFTSKASTAKNYSEMASNSQLACLSVLLRDCAENLASSTYLKEEATQYLSPLDFSYEKELFIFPIIAKKYADALDLHLGHTEYNRLLSRFEDEGRILKPFTEGDLKTVAGLRIGVSPNPGSKLFVALESAKENIEREKATDMINLFNDEDSQLLPYFYQALAEVESKNQDEAKMTCLIMAGIYHHASALKDDDLKVVIDNFDLFGSNLINDNILEFEDIFRFIQQLSFDYLENTLKDEIFAEGCPNNDCSQTLIEACCRTFGDK